MELLGGVDGGQLATIFAVFALGGFIKGVVGFGLPMVTMSLLVFVAPIDLALALNAIVQPVTNISQFFGERQVRATVSRFWPLVIMLVPGVAVGAYFLTTFSEEALLLTLGLFIVSFVVLNTFGVTFDIPARWERGMSLTLGFAAGILGALIVANGPIFVMYLVSLGVDRSKFRAALGLLFIVSGVLVTSGFVAVGVLDAGRAALAVLSTAPALAGMWLGNRFGARLGSERFRWAVLAGLFVLGLNFVGRGTGAL